jgi:4-amino-4-deoxy-L-arabinose transferase-like glycosyltransferase
MATTTTADGSAEARGEGSQLWAAIARWLATEGVLWALAIFVVAFALRLSLVAYINPSPRDHRFDDSVFYDSTARALADGRGYIWDPTIWYLADDTPVYPGERDTAPTALWPPGYPITLSVIYALTGDSLVAAKLANVLFGALTAVLTFLIGRRLFGLRPGIIAGIAVALWPTHILFTAVTMSEVYFTFLLALVMYLTVLWTVDEDRPHPAQLIVLGFVTGAAALTRGELSVFPIAFFLLFLALRRTWRTAGQWTLLIILGMAILFVPWTVRNRVQMDAWIVGTTGVGRAFHQGHNPEADGGPSLFPTLLLEEEYEHLDRPAREVESSQEAQRRALEWARDHPLQEFHLFWKRLHLMYRDDQSGIEWVQSNKPTFGEHGAERLAIVSNAYYGLLMALAIVGAPAWWAARRGRTVFVAIMPIAYYTLLFAVLFIGSNRYHVPIVPYIAILAAVPISVLAGLAIEQWRGLRSRDADVGGSAGLAGPVEVIQPEDEAPPPVDAEPGRL